MYNVYSAGDGAVLQHDIRQMNQPAVNLDDVISTTNSHVQSQVLLLTLNSYCFLSFEAQTSLQMCWLIVEFCVVLPVYLNNVHSCYDRDVTMALLTASLLQLGANNLYLLYLFILFDYKYKQIFCWICFRMLLHFLGKQQLPGVQITAIWQSAMMMG